VEVAVSQLGDDTNARELMEIAIAQAQELLVDQSEVSLDDVRQILTRCYRNAVRRAYRQQAKLSLWGASETLDRVRDSISSSTNHLDARLDLEVMLRDTPEDIRRALLLRYGARSSWEEIANETSSTKDGIRMRCKRELIRIAEHFGLTKQRTVRSRNLDDRR
jgi:DNA-directed RNA polymerase specialized sigma24 family protein